MPALLNSWKEIAAYMRRGVRTIQRWENDGLPIRRVGTGNRAPVFAFSGEIDKWLHRHRTSAPAHEMAPRSDSRKLVANSELLLRSLQRSGADFLFLDLGIATMMAGTALKAGPGTEKRARSQRIARRAYDTILYLSQRLKMPKDEGSELRKKLAALKHKLEQLGERF
jgi:hypothetical protein